MKTKFDQLLNAQKQKMLLCEKEIVKINNEVAAFYNQIDFIVAQIAQIDIPKNADFEEFLKINEVKKAKLHDIESYKLKIAESKQIIKDLKEQYRILYIEFEKIKYLQEKEQANIIKLLRKKEQKELDEMAIVLRKFK